MNSNHSNWKVFALAAAAVVMAGSATAQNSLLLGKIPFAFSVNGNPTQAAGDYVITRTGSLWLIRNAETRQAIAVTNAVPYQGHANESPSLTFSCVSDRCTLHMIRVGGAGLGVEVMAPRRAKLEVAQATEVVVPLGPSVGE